MNYYEVVKLLWDQVLIYLRKSRSDDPSQSVEEVLAKHETMLQEYAERELGGRIPEENIFREVISGGESIAEREAMRQVLARIEDPKIKGVLVVDPQRLSRGSLTDCDTLITSFELTKTLVVTPMMTYDLTKKMERKFFQDELLRGRDYLEYTKEILARGRIAAVKRGCYISSKPPYGFKRVKIGKDHTLEPIEEQAEVVRLIFDLYGRDRLTPYEIACRLIEMGIPGPTDVPWDKGRVRFILHNVHYIGKVIYNQRMTTPVLVDGKVVKKELVPDPEEIIVAEGKHPAIVTAEAWKLAHERIEKNPKTNTGSDLSNPLAGLLYCSKCGRAMRRQVAKIAKARFVCVMRPQCYKSVKVEDLLDALVVALETAELPELKLKLKNQEGDSRKIQEKNLKRLEKQLAEYKEQELTQYELVETKKYTPELFEIRHAALVKKMDECVAQIYQAKLALPASVDYEERVMALEAALAVLKDPTATPAQQNKTLKAIVERIDFTNIPSDPQNRVRLPHKGKTDPFTLAITLRL